MAEANHLQQTSLQTELLNGSDEPSVHEAHRRGQPDTMLVQQLVAARATVSPQALALAAGSESLTYTELDSRANQLAHHLKSLGAGPDQLVGLCMKRSPSMVVAALAILKAGGAYVPLDPSFPAERLAFMLRDAEVPLLVIEGDHAGSALKGSWRTVDLDKESSQIAGCPTTAPATQITPQNLAYVIYTSGSTGQPKGVEITHSGLANLISWHCRTFQVTCADRASHQAALGFDAAVWEIWPYLAAGASVHIPGESLRNNPEALRDWLVAEKITITFLPSPLAERMLLLEWPTDTALRVLLTGADTLRHRQAPCLPFVLVNNYGPTECTVVASSGRVTPAGSGTGLPSIGRPIDNTQIYILDEQRQSVPNGTVGEIYIGGEGLARGYRNNVGLTAERFVPNPLSSSNGNRLYRTGDRGRYLPNGEIEFLGRLDEQIKIRGYRIEPGEVVGALESHPDVQASVVILREDQPDNKKLAAYLILKPESEVSVTSLRNHLRQRLPDYMVPATFVRVQSLPLTVNGKVDRAALPLPSATNTLRDEEFVSPRSMVEQRLAAIIAPLLNVDRVGVNDNFFLLGGHSLLGTQLIARINQSFGVELSLLGLFDHPTLADMSAEIEKLIMAKIEMMGAETAAKEKQ